MTNYSAKEHKKIKTALGREQRKFNEEFPDSEMGYAETARELLNDHETNEEFKQACFTALDELERETTNG